MVQSDQTYKQETDWEEEKKKLIESVIEKNPNADKGMIKKAYELALKIYGKEKRSSGESHFAHCLEVTKTLISLKLDSPTIAAGLLHDTIETGLIKPKELKKEMGSEVLKLVEGVTQVDKVDLETEDEQRAENIRKVLLATSKDIRVMMIKLADRLHNMRTLKFLDEKSQKRISKETLEIYAPIAYKLGLFKIKTELEDLSIRFLKPEIYQELKEKVNEKKADREKNIKKIIEILSAKLEEKGINFKISGRAKSFYSIYHKMLRDKKNFEEIYDLLAARIIVDNVEACYQTLGVIHQNWKYLPNKFKDYIANPKPNGYKSIHTTLLYESKPVEIQIRTKEMHLEAEEGIASHWRYKGTERDKEFEKKITWFREILDWVQHSKKASEFVEKLRVDLFKDQIVVFTPKGDPIQLPEGATPIDFAFEVHTNLGLAMVGAKVNDKIVPLDYKLKSGEMVEVITKPNAKPSWQWLRLVTTTKARSKLTQAFGVSLGKKEEKKIIDDLAEKIKVRGVKNPQIRFTKCCAPKPGESVVGYRLKDGKIAVHSINCPNIETMDKYQRLEVRWKGEEKKQGLRKEIKITALDEIGVFAQILNLLTQEMIPVLSINTKSQKEHLVIDLILETKDEEHFKEVMLQLRYLKPVQDVLVVE